MAGATVGFTGLSADDAGKRLCESLQMAYGLTAFEMDLVGMNDAGQHDALALAARLPIGLAVRAHLRQLGWPTWNLSGNTGVADLLEVCHALAPNDPFIEDACRLLNDVPADPEQTNAFALRAYRFARDAGVQSWEDFFDANGDFTYFDQCAVATALLQAGQDEVTSRIHLVPPAPIEASRLRRLWQHEFRDRSPFEVPPLPASQMNRNVAEPDGPPSPRQL